MHTIPRLVCLSSTRVKGTWQVSVPEKEAVLSGEEIGDRPHVLHARFEGVALYEFAHSFSTSDFRPRSLRGVNGKHVTHGEGGVLALQFRSHFCTKIESPPQT